MSITVQKNPLLPTLALLTAGAAVGAVLAAVVALPAAMTAVAFSGPLGWLILGPIILAGTANAVTWVAIIVPIWALVGGALIASNMCGNGSLARQTGVTFFSDTHPVAVRTNELAADLGLGSIPHIGWYPADDINAFAAGTEPNAMLLAFSQGAVEKLTKDQMDAVIGHELAHVANNDMARMTYARGVQEALTFFLVFRGLKKLARWLFTPLSEIEILRFSRAREFTADAIGAQLTTPAAMASALEAIREDDAKPDLRDRHEVIRFSGWRTSGFFRTHPPLEARIERLNEMAASQEEDREAVAVVANDSTPAYQNSPPAEPAPQTAGAPLSYPHPPATGAAQSGLPVADVRGEMSFGS